MSEPKLKPFDPAAYRAGDEAAAAYLSETGKTGDPVFIEDARQVLARACEARNKRNSETGE